jgi:carboxypeptidase family protein/TonB-dependent receptor-like protein
MGRSSRAMVLVELLVALGAGNLAAQAITTAALYGVVHGADSAGIADAVVTVTNTADGGRWRTTTRADGRYAFEYLSVGGPYAIDARAIGFRPGGETGVTLSLGERRRADIALAPAVVQLAELTAEAPGARLNGSRTGPGQTFTGAEAAALPLDHRSFSQLVLLSPQAVVSRDTGISIAGQPDRLNGLQIDGASAADLGGIHGISGFGTPGQVSGLRVLPIEAIKDLQVLAAPFDVRYSGFAGGLINAITRSGGNRWEGSVSSYFQNQSLTGKDSLGDRAEEFSTRELAITLGGPIIRDRATFFLDVGLQRFVGARGPSLGTDTTGGADSVGFGIRRAELVRFRDILRDTYHVDPGSFGSEAPRNPSGNVLAKITLWPALNQRIELSHNHSEGNAVGGIDAIHLSSQGRTEPATFNDSRATWIAGGGHLTNELTLARVAATQRCVANAPFPQIDVIMRSGPDPPILRAGAVNGCPDRFANQTTWELTDNASWVSGAHHLTLGTHEENIHLDGSRRVRVPAGRWEFPSLDALEAGLPDSYVRDFAAPSQPDGPVSNFSVRQVGLYLQDQWAPWPRLVLTAGLRLDVPFVSHHPAYNPALWSAFGIDNAQTPSGRMLWSPRLGFTYDVGGRGATFLRGGAGLFAGRPMFLYFSNVFETTGLDWLRAACAPDEVPDFTIDPAQQPTSCVVSAPFVFEVNYFDPSFRFPRNLRLSLGADIRLPWEMVGTVDLLYIRGVDQFDITDVNLQPPTATAAGEGGRLLYGTFDEFGNALPNRRDPGFGTVAQIRNSRGDRSLSAGWQLEKRFGGGTHVSLAYTYTDARDRMSPDCFTVTCNLYLTPLDGTVDHRRLTTSNFSVAHKITLGVTANAPWHTGLGLFYNGFSGRPYTYMVHGDANADGLSFVDVHNDIMYVPKDRSDITLADPEQWLDLDRRILLESCLRSQRGRILRRNSCHGHWATVLNARVSKLFGTVGGHSVELITDLFNVLNLLDRDWGVQRTAPSALGDPEMLMLVGYDQANQRGIYSVIPVDRNTRDDGATRWRMQLGARYTF